MDYLNEIIALAPNSNRTIKVRCPSCSSGRKSKGRDKSLSITKDGQGTIMWKCHHIYPDGTSCIKGVHHENKNATRRNPIHGDKKCEPKDSYADALRIRYGEFRR